MFIKGFLKRFAPFFISLALGLFVASFFVTIAVPNVRFNRGWRNHREYHRRMEFENQRLKEENFRLNQENQLYRDSQQNKIISGRVEFDEKVKVARVRVRKSAQSVNDLVPPPPPIPVQPAPMQR
jgi:hypothetical protein